MLHPDCTAPLRSFPGAQEALSDRGVFCDKTVSRSADECSSVFSGSCTNSYNILNFITLPVQPALTVLKSRDRRLDLSGVSYPSLAQYKLAVPGSPDRSCVAIKETAHTSLLLWLSWPISNMPFCLPAGKARSRRKASANYSRTIFITDNRWGAVRFP